MNNQTVSTEKRTLPDTYFDEHGHARPLSDLEPKMNISALDNDQFHYPNMKISTQNLMRGPGGVYFAELTFGTSSPPQSFRLLVDTGSSWTWVTSCSSSAWAGGQSCPEYYFDEKRSSTLTCSEKTKSIGYGGASSSVEGPICEDEVKVWGTDDMETRMPIILNQASYDGGEPSMAGIMGLSPDDESAGPLFISYLYENDKIDRK